jgi:hypothetical protein
MAQEVILNVKANTKEAEASLKGVNSEIKNTQQVSGELSGSLDKMTGGAITKFTAFKGTIKGVTGGFKSLRVAILSTGIGALILAVTALTAAFTGSEEGQNKFAKIMTVIGALTGNLVDLLADLGEGIISVFENPKEALLNFKDLLVENITNRFTSILDTVGYVGKAMKLVFEGEFSKALDVGKKAANSLVDSLTGVPNTIDKATEATKNFVKEQIEEGKAAASVADMRAKADKIERKLVVNRSKLESEIALLRLKSRQEDEFTAQERKQALLDAQALEEQLLSQETEYLELRRDAQVLENTFSRSNKENLDKEAQAIAEVNRVVARRADAARSTQRELNRVSKEIERDEQAKAKEEQAKIDEAAKKEAERLAGIQKIQDEFKLKQEDKDAQTNLQKAELEEQRKLAELEALGAELAQQQEVRDYYAGIKLEAEQADAAASKDIDDKALQEKIANIQAEQSAREANLQTIANGLNGLQQVFAAFGKESRELAIAGIIVDQVASISRIVSNTAIANAKALNASPLTFGQPWIAINTISAAASIAGSIASAGKSIAALKGNKKTPLTGSVPSPSAGGGGGGGGITAAAQAPQFNIIGGGAQNQLAGLLADQTQKPVKAYVVSNEVSTAQSLDRNIVESATLG